MLLNNTLKIFKYIKKYFYMLKKIGNILFVFIMLYYFFIKTVKTIMLNHQIGNN